MFTIKNNVENELIIKKSKFITYLYKVDNISQIDKYLKDIKIKFNDANHHCYAFILNNKIKFSDDNEPSNTAGIPIYNILNKNQLTNVLAIVIRYFGGIKLGANGLIRAYSNSVKEALNKTEKIVYKEYTNIILNFTYEDLKIVNSLIKNKEIIFKSYDHEITYIIKLEKDEINNFKNKIANTNIKIKTSSN